METNISTPRSHLTSSGHESSHSQDGSPINVFANNFVAAVDDQHTSDGSDDDNYGFEGFPPVTITRSSDGGCGEASDGSASKSSFIGQVSPEAGDHDNDSNSPPYYVFATPNGTQFWIPNVGQTLVPVIGQEFNSLESALAMYAKYADEAGFCVKKGQVKVWLGIPTHRYLRCSRYGNPQSKKTFDTLDETSIKPRKSSFTCCNCKAHVLLTISGDGSTYKVKSFNDIHNHEFFEKHNRDLTKVSRKLSYSTKQFIHSMSLNRIGPVRAHRCLVAMKGGHHNVNGTVVDFKNFSKQLRIFIGDRDSQLFLDRLRDRFDMLPEFFFDFVVSDGKLKSVFWADEISKLNYKAFGDVLAFDATYHTNKYNMIFIPFTGIDHHGQCVTFGAGLITNETIESYVWLLGSFLKAHGSQPLLVLSDQDPAMLQAVPQVFTESRHRLCMWHIMKKLPSKISGDLLTNTDVRACIHRLVWSVYIKPSTFETRWQEMIDGFGLADNQWLNDMFAMKELWVPAYFREIPMSCLMKTTSRSESSNSSFKINSTGANTLVQFMLCFEARLDSQRYRQRVAEYKTDSTIFVPATDLPIEKHAFGLYTHAVFQDVKKEITKGKFSCYISNTEVEGDTFVFHVTQYDRRRDVSDVYQVKYDPADHTAECSCRAFIRIGYLCRHVFCVYMVNKVDRIPPKYIAERWLRDVLPKKVFSISSRYGVDTHPGSILRNEILELVTECVDVARTDEDALTNIVDQLKAMKINLLSGGSTIVQPSNDVEVEDIIGQSLDCEVVVANPDVARNKGCGKNRRISGPGENATTKRPKIPKAPRLCNRCKLYVTDHDSRNCEKVSAMKKAKESAERAARHA